MTRPEVMAHPDDILIVGTLQERRDFRQFTDRQILPVSTAGRSLRGRTFRTAWVTYLAMMSGGYGRVLDELHCGAVRSDGSIRPASEWKPENNALVAKIRALPDTDEIERMGNGDCYRGYREAILDVLALLAEAGLDES